MTEWKVILYYGQSSIYLVQAKTPGEALTKAVIDFETSIGAVFEIQLKTVFVERVK